ncbi:MAG: hypothetical protein JWN76_1046 [Chitinophagaceae bacterium]|nr:hypothetical protein [Chitinophagaceae bacterium]
MKKFDWKALLPHLLALAIFLIVAAVYCKPVMEGKVLHQQDIVQWKAMSKDAFNYKEKHGEFPLWINNMFSGMPSFQVGATYNNMLPYYFIDIVSLHLPKPISFFFLACVCFYFLAQVLGINRVVSILGALGFAYATYDPIIIAVGHDTKMLTIALMPAVVGSIILLFEKRYWSGTALTAVSTSMLIAANHQQIAYYTFLVVLAMTISYAIIWIRRKEFKHLILVASLALLGGLTGVLTNASILFTTYDFAKATIRGGSSLSKETDKNGGLNKDYALSYSMSKAEPLVLMFPKLFGGSSDKDERGESSKAMETLSSLPQQLQQQLQYNLRYYWGGIDPTTSGPPYIGAIICFLAIMGMFLVDDRYRWWIAAITFFAVLMAWGSYFEGFNTILLKYLPLYNKFRAPSMTMVIPQLVLPILACLSLNAIINYPLVVNKELFRKRFRNGLITTGVFFAIALMLYVSADFFTKADHYIIDQVKNLQQEVKEPVMSFLNALKEDRQALMINSILRSLFLILAAAGLIYIYLKGKIKPLLLTIIITVISFAEVMAVDVVYLNKDNYQEQEEYNGNFTPSAVDQQLLQDKSFYRIFNTTTDPFNDAMTSYYHNSVGGYNPAKLSIYQDLVERQLAKSPLNMPVYDMLNTKYFIAGNPAGGGAPQVQLNPGALGNAWFVKNVKFVNGPEAEMTALNQFSPKDTAIVDQRFKQDVNYDQNGTDTTASIRLVKNDNDYIAYESVNAKNGFGVFSEVYYDRGWKAFIDNKETAIAKVNYVLRGLSIPAGKHKLEFKFEPQAHKLGSTITSIFQVILILLILAAVGMLVKNSRRPTT